MKKLLITMLLVSFAIVSFAVKYDRKAWLAVDKKDWQARKDFWTVVDSPSRVMHSKLYNIVWSAIKLDNIDKNATFALIDKLVIDYKVADMDYIKYIKVIYLRNSFREYDAALALAQTLVAEDNIHAKRYIGHCYDSVKEYDKAIAAFNAAERYYRALQSQIRLDKNDDASIYKFCKKAMLKQNLNVKQVNKVLNHLVAVDLDEVGVSDAQFLKLLKKIRRKYSKSIKTKINGVVKREFVYEDLQAQIKTLIDDMK